MPATTKEQLLDTCIGEFEKLSALIDACEPKTALIKNADGVSIKDIVAHRAHWIQLFLHWYEDGQNGKTVYFPAKGYKWNELKRYNADLRDKQSHLSWNQAVELLREKHGKLLHLIRSNSNQALYDKPMKGSNNHWTTGRYAEAAGASHYRSASKYLRQRLK